MKLQDVFEMINEAAYGFLATAELGQEHL